MGLSMGKNTISRCVHCVFRMQNSWTGILSLDKRVMLQEMIQGREPDPRLCYIQYQT